MIMGKFLLLCIFLFIELSARTDSVTIFLVKQRWHTGIVIQVSDIDSSYFPEVRYFSDFRFIDTGWGDEEFYRYPDFDAELAYKALFYSTPSTIRIEGFNFSIEKYLSISDQGFQINLDRNSFNRLCSFLSATFEKDDGEVNIIEKRYNGNIIFFEAKGKYNLFNTCNTWVAYAFNKAGLKIDGVIILAEQLFDELEDMKQAKRLK
jgi:uncharacterized protein (TIGR02117 family)